MILCISSLHKVTFICSVLTYLPYVTLSQQTLNTTSTIYGETTLKNSIQQNSVKGIPLETCSLDPLTGFFRDGYCRTADQDYGSHTVCARMTKSFLDFTKSQGNDLSTPRGRSFPGLKHGDYWCLCAVRWLQGFKMGKVIHVKLGHSRARTLVGVTARLPDMYYSLYSLLPVYAIKMDCTFYIHTYFVCT